MINLKCNLISVTFVYPNLMRALWRTRYYNSVLAFVLLWDLLGNVRYMSQARMLVIFTKWDIRYSIIFLVLSRRIMWCLIKPWPREIGCQNDYITWNLAGGSSAVIPKWDVCQISERLEAAYQRSRASDWFKNDFIPCSAPSHHLHLWGLITNEPLMNKLQWKIKQNSNISSVRHLL